MPPQHQLDISTELRFAYVQYWELSRAAPAHRPVRYQQHLSALRVRIAELEAQNEQEPLGVSS